MKNLITIFLIVLLTILVLTSLIKLIKNLNNSNTSDYNMIESKNVEIIQPIPKWIKNNYFLPNGSWEIQGLDRQLIPGKKYFLVQNILNVEKCFFGIVFYSKMQNNNLYFKSDKQFNISRLKQYSKIKSKKIITNVYSEKDISILGKIQNCSEWVKIENN